MQNFFERIHYRGSIDDIALAVCKDFKIGKLISSKLVTIGYEDFNFLLETSRGKFFVKVFASFRSDTDCHRYIDIVSNVLKKGVKTPHLYQSGGKYLYSKKIGGSILRLCLMEYIDGENYYALRKKPDPNEITYLAQQASLINSSKMQPRFMYDSWAVTSFGKEFKKKAKYLTKRDLALMEPLSEEFKNMNFRRLPHCLVHGDLLSTNVMKDKNGGVWIIDFSVANDAPRIQELAVLACDMLFVGGDKEKSEDNVKIALEEYQKNIKLTGAELEILPVYIKLAHAMNLLSANYLKEERGNNSEENNYWISQGRMGLRQMLNI